MQKVIAYTLAGGILLLIADVAPGFAVGTASVMLLSVALARSGQITSVSNFISQNTKR